MKKYHIIFLFLFLFLFSQNCLAIAVIVPEENSSLMDRDYILGTELLIYNYLPYLFTGYPDLIAKYISGTSVADSFLGRNIDSSIMGNKVTLSEDEYEVFEAISPFIGEKLDIVLNASESNQNDGSDSFLLSYYDNKKQILNNIISLFNYIISLFVMIKEFFAIIIQLAVFVLAVLVFIELLPNLFVFIKEQYRAYLTKNINKIKR